jgi:hypothetical protein
MIYWLGFGVSGTSFLANLEKDSRRFKGFEETDYFLVGGLVTDF